MHTNLNGGRHFKHSSRSLAIRTFWIVHRIPKLVSLYSMYGATASNNLQEKCTKTRTAARRTRWRIFRTRLLVAKSGCQIWGELPVDAGHLEAEGAPLVVQVLGRRPVDHPENRVASRAHQIHDQTDKKIKIQKNMNNKWLTGDSPVHECYSDKQIRCFLPKRTFAGFVQTSVLGDQHVVRDSWRPKTSNKNMTSKMVTRRLTPLGIFHPKNVRIHIWSWGFFINLKLNLQVSKGDGGPTLSSTHVHSVVTFRCTFKAGKFWEHTSQVLQSREL